MKRAFVIIMGLLMTVCFSVYILEIKPFSDNDYIGCEDGTAVVLIECERDRTASEDGAPQAMANYEPAQTEGAEQNADGWKLIWADEFDKRNIDLEYWTEVDREHNYNNELQYYLPENSYIEDGCLCLTARKEKRASKRYTSAMVETRGKLALLYGRVEARVKLPVGKGLFPAVWMLNQDGNYEIDIMEMIGSEPDLIYGVNHYQLRGRKKTVGSFTCGTPEEFHIYSVEWDEDEIRWYIDGTLFHKSEDGVPSEYMHLVLNLAVGGDWPGDPDRSTAFPCCMKVDYIRIYNR